MTIKRHLTKLITYLQLISVFFFFSYQPILAQPQDWSNPCTVAVSDVVPNSTDTDDVATIQGLECLVANVLSVAVSLIGVAILVMLVLGAYRILTSGGDPKAVEGGKNTITYAILGLILALSAWFILQLIARFTGANILIFSTQV